MYHNKSLVVIRSAFVILSSVDWILRLRYASLRMTKEKNKKTPQESHGFKGAETSHGTTLCLTHTFNAGIRLTHHKKLGNGNLHLSYVFAPHIRSL